MHNIYKSCQAMLEDSFNHCCFTVVLIHQSDTHSSFVIFKNCDIYSKHAVKSLSPSLF